MLKENLIELNNFIILITDNCVDYLFQENYDQTHIVRFRLEPPLMEDQKSTGIATVRLDLPVTNMTVIISFNNSWLIAQSQEKHGKTSGLYPQLCCCLLREREIYTFISSLSLGEIGGLSPLGNC